MRGSFGSYRAIDDSIAQNAKRKTKLTLPILAVGGAKGIGERVVATMRSVGDRDVGRRSKAAPEWHPGAAGSLHGGELRQFLLYD